ncbi:MAG: GreA/GreB family elongation factor [Firmicutes bacterium]|nr:GreA/GreB family elongation factor [Bacillota bacterium]
MTRNIVLAPLVFEGLIQHLADMDEVKSGKDNRCFPRHLIENGNLSEFLEAYLSTLENTLGNISTSEEATNDFPLVIIGSQIEIEDLDEGGIFKHRIVPPFQSKVIPDDISCLSPLGRALLLKSVGDLIEVNVPMGKVKYRIVSVRL